MLHITLRDGRCDIILNVHSPTEDKSDDNTKYHTEILLGDFNAD